MGIEKDTKKDLTVAASALATLAVTLSPFALVASGAIVATAWNRVASRAQRRANELMRSMLLSDAEPDRFAAQLQARVDADEPDDDVLAGFRALLLSAVDAVTPESIPAMGFVGRRLFRNECHLRDARAALRVLDIVDRRELSWLRTFMIELARIGADVLVVGEMPERKNGDRRAWFAWDRAAGPEHRSSITSIPDSAQFFSMLKRVGVGAETGAYGIGGSRQAIEIDRGVIRLLADALEASVT